MSNHGKPDRLRVCLLSAHPPIKGGVADYTAELALRLHEAGQDVTVISYEGESSYSPEEPYSVVRFSRDSKMLPIRVAKQIDKIDPDIIHVQSTQFLHPRLTYLFPLFISVDTPVVTTAHEVPWVRQFHMLPFQKILYRYTDYCVVHTDQVRNKLVERGFAKTDSISKIPHGAPVERFDEWSSDPTRPPEILFFGFLRPGKGVLTLVDAFERIKQRGSDSRLVLAGGLPESQQNHNPFASSRDLKTEITSRVSESSWAAEIELTGYVPDEEVRQYFERATVQVFPYEGSDQSGPLHIGLAAGLPIVAHDVGGFSELLSHGETGLLYSPNTPDQLASAIQSVLSDSELRDMLGRNARKKAESIAWPRIARKTARLYQEVLADQQ